MLTQPGGPFVDLDKLDLRKYAQRPALARALCDYCLYHDRNPRKAVELASLATVNANFKDWWWKERLGKGYYALGLLRDAEKQFRSSLNDCATVSATQQLAKIYIRLDQPFAAVGTFETGASQFPGETSMLLGQARICDALGEIEEGVLLYKQVLKWDASNVEAVACLGTFFYPVKSCSPRKACFVYHLVRVSRRHVRDSSSSRYEERVTYIPRLLPIQKTDFYFQNPAEPGAVLQVQPADAVFQNRLRRDRGASLPARPSVHSERVLHRDLRRRNLHRPRPGVPARRVLRRGHGGRRGG